MMMRESVNSVGIVLLHPLIHYSVPASVLDQSVSFTLNACEAGSISKSNRKLVLTLVLSIGKHSNVKSARKLILL